MSQALAQSESPTNFFLTELNHILSSPQYQMAGMELYQANHIPGDAFPPILHQPQNAGVPPAADHGQLADNWENIPQPVGGFPVPGRMQDPHYINEDHRGMVGVGHHRHHPAPLGDPAIPYVFPEVRLGHGDLVQAQHNAPEHQEHARFGYAPQVAPGPIQAAFPNLPPHQNPAPGQPVAVNLRQFASHYLNHPNSQVMIFMEPGPAGRCKMTIILDMAGLF